jgi:transcriptional regulator with XRE-family HTH domain
MSSISYASKRKAGTLHFGEWLRRLREERKLPLRAVAAAAEMDQSHLSKAELCQRLLTAGQVAAIARFLKVDGTELEARRIAEKFRMEHADNPAALQALQILNDSPLKSG